MTGCAHYWLASLLSRTSLNLQHCERLSNDGISALAAVLPHLRGSRATVVGEATNANTGQDEGSIAVDVQNDNNNDDADSVESEEACYYCEVRYCSLLASRMFVVTLY
jgi:hypothetical protein